jgi:hypothetical protein
MAIDITIEKIVSFKEARSHLPERRGGKRPDIATLYRWTVNGCNGIRLESIMVGATRMTSMEALQRFFDRLTEAAEPNAGDAATVAPRPATKTRQRQIEASERDLAKKPTSARRVARATS